MAFFRQIKERLAHYTWDLAYGEYSDIIINQGFVGVHLHVVTNPYKKKWFADPFILKESETELHLLVEEFDSEVRRGRIAHLTINKEKDVISDCNIILDLPTHLSFPAIYRIGGDVFVHPENSRSGKSYLYRYDHVTDMLIDPVCVCDQPIADAIIVSNDDHFEMYATRDPKPNGNILVHYVSNSFTGPYKEKSLKEYKGNIARMAGAFLPSTFGIVRPAQDCNGAYGRAILFMEGDTIISELRPNKIKFAGIHTFNTLANTFVIDLKKYDYPLLYHIKSKLK